MDAKELRLKSPEELQRLATELRSTLRGLHFKVSTKQLKEISVIRSTRRTLARVLTELARLKRSSSDQPTV